MPFLPKTRITIPKAYSQEERLAIASDIVDFIVKRTQKKRLDKDNKPLKAPYSKSYSESLEFKIAGKSKNKVDLTLSGDMLASLEVVGERKGSVTVGFTDEEQGAKADGNIRGTYGQSRRNSSKARDFLGIHKDDLKKILNKYPLNDKEKLSKSVEKSNYIDAVSEEIASKIELENVD